MKGHRWSQPPAPPPPLTTEGNISHSEVFSSAPLKQLRAEEELGPARGSQQDLLQQLSYTSSPHRPDQHQPAGQTGSVGTTSKRSSLVFTTNTTSGSSFLCGR